MTKGLEVGDKLIARFDDKICDKVTKGKEYSVTKVSNAGFFIVNDNGKEVFPIYTSFEKVSKI